MILLHHVGRRSGDAREAVVEVVRYDAMTDSFVICSGFGEQSQWFQNVMAQPDITITSKRRTIDVHAVRLPPEVAAKELTSYGERHPRAVKKLMSYLELDPDEEKATGYANASQALPVLHLTPRRSLT
jgi:deazaflavin-dependent oxidoreductase (nitroreductase family)